MARRRLGPALPVLTLVALLATCSRDRTLVGPRTWRTPLGSVTGTPPTVLVGAGDIAECSDIHDEETAALLDGIPGTVFAAGDLAYDLGSDADFQNCYDPSWGRHKARTRPAPGNHEYNTPDAAGYFNYFGATAGDPGKGYYSYNLGDWHIIALNNYLAMGAGSEQDNWLQADLQSTTQPCKLAYYHEPLYSSITGSGSGGATTNSIRPMFTTLYNGGVDVVLNGHRHFYERLAPMNPDGQLDVTAGIREFIVGTGGASIGNPTNAFPLSEVRFGSSNYGVLKLYLYSDSYAWRFVPVPGKTLSDTGSFACHGAGSGVSASQSTVTAAPTSIVPGGQSTITVTARDGFGTPVSDAAVVLSVTPETGTTLTPSSGTTNSSGVFTATLSSTELGDKTVSATANGTAINQTAVVTVAAPSVLTHTLLTSGNNTVNQKVYTTASIAPTPNTLVTVAVLGHQSTAATPSPVLSGGGMTTWTEVASVTFDAVATPHKRLTVYRAMSASPGSGPLTITFASTVSNCQWVVSQWGGVDLTGVNGAGAIVQSGSNRGDAVTGLGVTLAPFAHANNAAYGVFGVTSNAAIVTPGAGFTELAEQPSAESPGADLQTEWRVNDNTIDASWTSRNAGALGIEIKAAASGSGSGVDALQSAVSAAPTSITAAGTGSTITVTVKDASGLAISGSAVEVAATGSGNTLAPSSGSTDGSGVFTTILTSTVAETKSVSATADGTAIAQHAAVAVTAGAVSATHSTVTASPTSIAVGSGSSAITLTVLDAYDNPIGAAMVELQATPEAGNILTQPSVTDAGGLAVGSLSSSVEGTKTVSARVSTDGGVNWTQLTQTAQVSVTSQASTPITHTLLAAGNNPVNQKVYTTGAIAPASNTLVTVAVMGHQATSATPSPTLTGGGMSAWTEVATTTFDVVGTPHKRLTIFRALSATPGSGPLTITFASTVSNCQWIVSQWSGVDPSGVNGVGAIVQTGSNRADAVTGLTVALAALGGANNVAYGVFGVSSRVLTVTPGSGFTEVAEQPSGESPSSDLQAEWTTNDATIDASWASNLNGGALGVEIKAGTAGAPGVDPGLSTVEAAPTSITPGGAGSTITVAVKDASGAPISGATVVLEGGGSGGTFTQPSGGTDGNGEVTGIFSSTVAGNKVVSARANGTLIAQTATVMVMPGPVSGALSTLTATPTAVASGEAATLTVTVKDAFGNAISGATVELTATPGTGNTLTQPGLTDANGVATGTLSSTAAEQKLVSARASTDGGVTWTAIDQTTTVTVTGEAVDAGLSTVTAAPSSIEAGSGSSIITVTARNASGTPVSGAAVAVTVTPAPGTTLTAASGTADENGVFTTTLTATKAGAKSVSATANGRLITQTAPVTVTPAPVSGAVSTLTASPTTITTGTGVATLAATVKDAFGNAISGATVELTATPTTGNTLTQPTGLTNASGVATGTLSSTVAEQKLVSARASTDGGVTWTAIDQTVTVTVVPPTVTIGHTLLTAGNNTVNQKLFTTAAIAPAPSTLITVAVLGHNATSALASPTLSGGGMTAWTEVASVTFDAVGTPHKRLTIYRALSAAPGSGPLTITWSTAVSNCQWVVSQWDGVDQSGVNGEGAIGQTGSSQGDGVSSLSVSLAPFGNANNVAYGAFGVTSSVLAVTPGAGFTEIGEQPSAESPASDLEAEWTTNDPTIDASWTLRNAAALGVEIKVRPPSP